MTKSPVISAVLACTIAGFYGAVAAAISAVVHAASVGNDATAAWAPFLIPIALVVTARAWLTLQLPLAVLLALPIPLAPRMVGALILFVVLMANAEVLGLGLLFTSHRPAHNLDTVPFGALLAALTYILSGILLYRFRKK